MKPSGDPQLDALFPSPLSSGEPQGDLEPSREIVVVPLVGQGVALDSPTRDLAAFLSDVRELESQLRAAKNRLNDELHARMDRERKWTLKDGDYEVRGESDEPKVEWDGQKLDALLMMLEGAGTITEDARLAAVEPQVTFKVKAAGINALRKNPALREKIDACGTEVPVTERQRRVKVTRR